MYRNSKHYVSQIKEIIFSVYIQLRHVNCQNKFFMLLTHRCPADQSTCLGYAESPWELSLRNGYCRNQLHQMQ